MNERYFSFCKSFVIGYLVIFSFTYIGCWPTYSLNRFFPCRLYVNFLRPHWLGPLVIARSVCIAFLTVWIIFQPLVVRKPSTALDLPLRLRLIGFLVSSVSSFIHGLLFLVNQNLHTRQMRSWLRLLFYLRVIWLCPRGKYEEFGTIEYLNL